MPMLQVSGDDALLRDCSIGLLLEEFQCATDGCSILLTLQASEFSHGHVETVHAASVDDLLHNSHVEFSRNLGRYVR
jgi:hypothetical protein